MTEKKDLRVLGLMSGTSLDGVDLALCKFNFEGEFPEYKLLAASTIPYPYYLKEQLEDALHISPQDLHNLDQELGDFFAKCIIEFNEESGEQADLIASHGHTILHQPDKGITMQIGDGDQMAQKTGIVVINDFRIQDVAKGGQGAPLVPMGDRDLFKEYDFCLNLGGIANMSFDKDSKRIACDISPCNMAFNTITSWIDMEFDKNGSLAAAGNINPDLLERLNSLDYYEKAPPKSLGKEWFLRKFLPELRNSGSGINDLLRTVSEHISDQVSRQINKHGNEQCRVLVTGGGAFNSYLISRLKEKSSSRIIIPDKDLVNFKEAIVFAYLGALKIKNRINVLASVTGASSDTSAGVVNFPNK